MKIMEKPAQLVFSSVKPQISSICLENNGNTEQTTKVSNPRLVLLGIHLKETVQVG